MPYLLAIRASLAVTAGLDGRIAALTAGHVLVLAVGGPVAVAGSAHLARRLPGRWFPAGDREAEPVPAPV